jgi:serine/threonine protein kinase
MSMPKISIDIEKKYRFIQQIGQGSFGKVYLVFNKEDGKKYACKVENKKPKTKNRLKGEANIYKHYISKKIECVPEYHAYIETTDNNMLMMQLLGKSLDGIFEECDNSIDTGTVMKIGITIIRHLETIHRSGFIHRDIKPNNFMFGANDDNNKLYVMDFGLSKKWCVYDKETNELNHIPYKSGRSMIGTARYASLNVHLGTEPSRRDDMESVGYMLIYLIKGTLPWQGLKKKTKENQIDKIGEKKMMVDIGVLCQGLPKCFYDYVKYTRGLQFADKPDYDHMVSLFENSAKKEGINMEYYWVCDKQQQQQPQPIITKDEQENNVNNNIIDSRKHKVNIKSKRNIINQNS